MNRSFIGSLTICALALFLRPVSAEEKFPFTATITEDKVNVRLTSSVYSDILATLSLNDKVVVKTRKFDWYKIVLPRTLQCYIYSGYVDIASDPTKGTVNADNINLRMGADLKSTIVGTVDRGEDVMILSKHGKWLRVIPSSNIFGWVHSRFVKFLYEGTPEEEAKRVEAMRLAEEAKKKAEAEELKKRQEEQRRREQEEKEKAWLSAILLKIRNERPFASGILKAKSGFLGIGGNDQYFRVVSDTKETFYLNGLKEALRRYNGKRIKVWARPGEPTLSHKAVFNVKRIEIIK